MKWKEVSWILRGRLKHKVIIALNKPKTATILSKEFNTHRSTISDILNQMEKKGMVLCLDPEQPYNRFYKLTKKGEKILKEINRNSERLQIFSSQIFNKS